MDNVDLGGSNETSIQETASEAPPPPQHNTTDGAGAGNHQQQEDDGEAEEEEDGQGDYLKPGRALEGDPSQQCAYEGGGRTCRAKQTATPGKFCDKHSCPNCGNMKRSGEVTCTNCT